MSCACRSTLDAASAFPAVKRTAEIAAASKRYEETTDFFTGFILSKSKDRTWGRSNLGSLESPNRAPRPESTARRTDHPPGVMAVVNRRHQSDTARSEERRVGKECR